MPTTTRTKSGRRLSQATTTAWHAVVDRVVDAARAVARSPVWENRKAAQSLAEAAVSLRGRERAIGDADRDCIRQAEEQLPLRTHRLIRAARGFATQQITSGELVDAAHEFHDAERTAGAPKRT